MKKNSNYIRFITYKRNYIKRDVLTNKHMYLSTYLCTYVTTYIHTYLLINLLTYLLTNTRYPTSLAAPVNGCTFPQASQEALAMRGPLSSNIPFNQNFYLVAFKDPSFAWVSFSSVFKFARNKSKLCKMRLVLEFFVFIYKQQSSSSKQELFRSLQNDIVKKDSMHLKRKRKNFHTTCPRELHLCSTS